MTGRVSIERIKAAVAAEFEVPLNSMVSAQRGRDIARPRQVAMALACDLTPHSTPLIGRLFGGRDHTTVMYARARVAELRAGDADLDRRVRRIKDGLTPSPPIATPEEWQLAFLDGPLFDRELEPA